MAEATATPRASVAPKHPILSNTVGTVRFGEGYGMPAAVVDPSIYGDAILFATGASENACDRLVRLNPETGAFENIEVVRDNDTLRYPIENADTIIYVDAKAGGGGIACSTRRRRRTPCSASLRRYAEAPVRTPYRVDRARRGLIGQAPVCDITTDALLTLAVFDAGSPYASSDPSLKSGQVLYADADAAREGSSLIRAVLLSDGSGWDYAAGSYVHDPKSAGDRWAYLTGNHDAEDDLYISLGGGSPKRIAHRFDLPLRPCVVTTVTRRCSPVLRMTRPTC